MTESEDDREALIAQLTDWLNTAGTLRQRLAGRSRSETFYPGSLAPELMRRSNELLDEGLPLISALLAALSETQEG